MTIKELHEICAPHIYFVIGNELPDSKRREMELDRDNPILMQAFEEVIIKTLEMTCNDENTLRIIPEIQLLKKRG